MAIYDSSPKNIFLHFLNFDTQDIFCLDERFPNIYLESCLQQALYIAILLCKSYTFLPLGFIYESETTRKLLLKMQPLLSEGLIRLSLREQNITMFLEKKQKGYKSFRTLPIYSSFFEKNASDLFKKVTASLVGKEKKIGHYCTEKWMLENRDPSADSLKKVLDKLDNKINRKQFQDIISSLPERYSETPFIWPSFEKILPSMSPKNKNDIRCIFEKYYYQAYMEEYHASIMFDIPFAVTEFGLTMQWTPMCSYQTYLIWLKMIGIDFYVASANPSQIVELKYIPEFIILNGYYRKVSSISKNKMDFLYNCAKLALHKQTRELAEKLKEKLGIRRTSVMKKKNNAEGNIVFQGPIYANYLNIGQKGGVGNQNVNFTMNELFGSLSKEFTGKGWKDETQKLILEIIDEIKENCIKNTLKKENAISLLSRLKQTSEKAYNRTIELLGQTAVGVLGAASWEAIKAAILHLSGM